MIMNDTIAAISSGLTESGIGIVRMSGPDSYAIINRIFRGKQGNHVDLSDPNRVHYGFISDVSRETSEGETADDKPDSTVDEVLVINLKAPHSYTGEDTIEINCHGGVLMMKRILSTLLKAGARLADPGEFTKRAFLNGRIDLAQAEAVIDVINARNDQAIRASVSQLRGSISKEITEIRNGILHDTAYIESALDDPEHYSLDGWCTVLEEDIRGYIDRIETLVRSYRYGKLVKEGIRTVIAGRPNAGKSSLLNAILGEERAIVTQIAGTTRDTITESVSLGGLTLNLMDTAGIRATDDPVESIGVKRALDSVSNADLVLCVFDAAAPLDDADREILGLLSGIPVKTLVLFNKTDKETILDIKEVLGLLPPDKRDHLMISALTGSGISELTKKIEELFSLGEVTYNEQLTVSSLRHVELLKSSLDSLKSVIRAIHEGLPEDFYTVDLMDAYTSLGRILGEEVDDDLVNEIFSRFCMGK